MRPPTVSSVSTGGFLGRLAFLMKQRGTHQGTRGYPQKVPRACENQGMWWTPGGLPRRGEWVCLSPLAHLLLVALWAWSPGQRVRPPPVMVAGPGPGG